MKKRMTGLLAVTLAVLHPVLFPAGAQQPGDLPLPERVQLVDEHRSLDWEAVSLSLLVREVEAAAAEEGLQDFSVDVAGNTISIIYRDLQFPPDSPEITPETGEKINSLSTVLQRFANRSLLVEGHTAQVPGDPDDGTILSGQRARAVADAMAATGIFTRRMISAEGRGEYEPIATNDTPEGRALNRRVEISVFDQVDEGATVPQSVWWKQYTDWKDPGATVFMVNSTAATVFQVRAALAREEQRTGAPVGDLPVVRTSEGIAVIYDQAEFTALDQPTGATRMEVTGVANALAQLDPAAQVRVGGFTADISEQRVAQRHYNLGLVIASASEIKPSATLVGDRPQAFLFESPEYFDPDEHTLVPSWTVSRQPDGGDGALTGEDTFAATFTASVEGAYELTLDVFDEDGILRSSGTVEVQVTVEPQTVVVEAPVASADDCLCDFIYSAELSVVGSLPLGRYRDFSNGGIGGNARFDILVPRFQDRRALAPIRFGLGINGLYHIPRSIRAIEDPWEFGWRLSAGYVFAVGQSILITPQIGYGGTVHVLTYTQPENSTTFGDRDGRSHYSQTLSTELDLAWRPAGWSTPGQSQLGVFLRPGYRFFTRIPRLMIAFDDDFLGHSLSVHLGARIYF